MKQEIIDLTYVIAEEGSKYPTDPAPRIMIRPPTVSKEGKLKSGYTELVIRTHHGTHIDAPAHKILGGKTIDQYLLSKFINPAILIDLTQHLEPALGYVREISESLLRKILTGKLLHKMREAVISALLFRTGYDKIIERGVTDDFNFPYFQKEAAQFLIKALEDNGVVLNILGLDSFSFDQKGTWDSPAHCAFLSKDILVVETLINLEILNKVFDSKPFEFVCVPIPYKAADGAQIRAFARALIQAT